MIGRSPLATALSNAALILFFGVIVIPIVWMVMTAFKPAREVYTMAVVFTPTLENFVTIFKPPWSIGHRIVNSVLVTFFTLIIAIPVSVLAAYSFSRFDFFMKRGLFSSCWRRNSCRRWW